MQTFDEWMKFREALVAQQPTQGVTGSASQIARERYRMGRGLPTRQARAFEALNRAIQAIAMHKPTELVKVINVIKRALVNIQGAENVPAQLDDLVAQVAMARQPAQAWGRANAREYEGQQPNQINQV